MRDPSGAFDMTKRKWLPADWLDEMNPGMQDSPDGFIERAGDGWELRLPIDDPDRDNEFYRMAVEPGQVIAFMSVEIYGDIALTVLADGTYRTDSGLAPTATHLYEPISGTIAYSLDELVKGDRTTDPLEPGDYEVSTYTWSDPIAFRLELGADGAAKFVPSAGVN